MVTHTQTIRRQQRKDCFSVFDYFMGLGLKGLKSLKTYLALTKTTSLYESHKKDHHRCLTFFQKLYFIYFLERTCAEKKKKKQKNKQTNKQKKEANAMEFSYNN